MSHSNDQILPVITANLPLHSVSLCIIQQIRGNVLVSYSVGSGSELLIRGSLERWRSGGGALLIY